MDIDLWIIFFSMWVVLLQQNFKLGTFIDFIIFLMLSPIVLILYGMGLQHTLNAVFNNHLNINAGMGIAALISLGFYIWNQIVKDIINIKRAIPEVKSENS